MNNENINLDELEDDTENESYPLEYFDLTSTPNDFNISTIISFMDRKVFQIPSFQRNFVWDKQKASKLIESLIIGLPIPQIFLYEKERNIFSIIDGQQRLLSLYFFYKGRFPKNHNAILKLREKESSSEKEFIKESLLQDDNYFSNFSLQLECKNSPIKNELNGFNFMTLDDDKRDRLELATIRNMVIKPKLTNEEDLHLAMFEIFNRLNSGGMNLNQQEIRMTLYNSLFMEQLEHLNKNESWRLIIGKPNSDIRLKDCELILRLFAMLINGTDKNKTRFTCEQTNYQGSIVAFLNKFANFSKKITPDDMKLLEAIWNKFCLSISKIPTHYLSNTKENKEESKLSIPVLEAIFFGMCKDALDNKDIEKVKKINIDSITNLKQNNSFIDASVGKTTSRNNIQERLNIAYNTL